MTNNIEDIKELLELNKNSKALKAMRQSSFRCSCLKGDYKNER